MVMRRGNFQISAAPNGRRRYIDLVTGEGIFIGNNGVRKPIEDSLTCDCGSTEFTTYVRRHLDPFPYSTTNHARREITNLWPGRKLIVYLTETNNTDDCWDEMARVFSFNEWSMVLLPLTQTGR
jgi:hypothetical protein